MNGRFYGITIKINMIFRWLNSSMEKESCAVYNAKMIWRWFVKPISWSSLKCYSFSICEFPKKDKSHQEAAWAVGCEAECWLPPSPGTSLQWPVLERQVNCPATEFQFSLVLTTSGAAILHYHVVIYSRMCMEANMCDFMWDKLASLMSRWLFWSGVMKERNKNLGYSVQGQNSV